MSNSIPRRSVAVATPTTQDFSSKRGQWQLCGKLVITDKEAAAIAAKPAGVPSVFRSCIAGDVIVLARDMSDNGYAPRWNKDAAFKDNTAFAATPAFTLKDVLTNCLSESSELDPKKSAAFAASLRVKYEEARKQDTASILAML